MISAAELLPVANHLWQSTLFGIAIWVVTLALRRNQAKVRHRLWLAASVKFLIPFALLASLGSLIPTGPSPIAPSVQIVAVVETISEPFAASDPQPAYVQPVEPVPSLQPAESLIPTFAVALWALGFIGNLLWWFLRWLQVRRTVQRGTPLDLDTHGLPVRMIKHAKQMEPGVFGVFRPVLILPEGITERLSTAELQSVIAHERCHIRRCDNSATAVHMFVETIFWFHPLVWWIKARLIDEQERACDEEVLARGVDPQVYAESILKICKLYVDSPLACVAGIAGSNLKHRIENIMRCRIGLRLGFARATLITLGAIVALVSPVVVGMVQARVARPEAQLPSIAIPPFNFIGEPGARARISSALAAPQSGRTGRQQSVEEQPAPVAQTVPATVIHGTWEIENPAMVGPNRNPFPGRFQFTFDRRTGKSFGLDSSPFRGLSSEQMETPVAMPTRFQLDTEAGNFICEGTFQAGLGRGTYVFYPDAGFLAQMATLGFAGISEQQLVSMALHGVGPQFLGELRSAGIVSLTFDQLMGMRAVGVTADYVRRIQQAGYSPIADELISMWVQGVTPEFANEIRQWYAAASPNDLVGMRVNGVTAEFARQVRQSDPSASIEDVLSMRTQGVPSNGGSNSLRIYRSTPPRSTNLPRTWSIEARIGRNGASPDRVQLKFLSPSGVQSTTVSFNPSVFRGLTTEQIMSATQTMVRFDIVRDAGTFACEGYFRDGRGSGTFVFQPNPEFRARMQALGIQDIDERWLFAMALFDVSLQFDRELRDAGVAASSASQLVTLRIQGVTSDYARDVRNTYPSASINQLINMRVQNVTPDFIREIRQLYPSASINDLINMHVQNVTPEFAREMNRAYPSVSIRDLINMKVQGIARR